MNNHITGVLFQLIYNDFVGLLDQQLLGASSGYINGRFSAA